MNYELPSPSFGDLGEVLDKLEPGIFLSCGSLSRFTSELVLSGFSSLDSLPSIYEPTPIDPKSSMVVDKFLPRNQVWHGDDDYDIIVSNVRNLIVSASKSSNTTTTTTTSYEADRVTSARTQTPPQRNLDDLALFEGSSAKRPRTQEYHRCILDEELPPSLATTVSDLDNDASSTGDDAALRRGHVEQWGKRYSELVEFHKQHGHCLVPLNWAPNPSLAHWVKRQRYQYRIKIEGKHSTMSDERERALQELRFSWDSHSAAWLERWEELANFKRCYGHTNVPKKFSENQPLAVWVKCQRRQYKLFVEGRNSNMTSERIQFLQSLGFVFNPRKIAVTVASRDEVSR